MSNTNLKRVNSWHSIHDGCIDNDEDDPNARLVIIIWQYGLYSFLAGGKKLERFLQKNQHKCPKEIIEF